MTRPTASSWDQAIGYQWSGCAPTRRKSIAFGEFAGCAGVGIESSSSIVEFQISDNQRNEIPRITEIRSTSESGRRPGVAKFHEGAVAAYQLGGDIVGVLGLSPDGARNVFACKALPVHTRVLHPNSPGSTTTPNRDVPRPRKIQKI